jgi:cytochrome c oxidase subunit 6b
MQVIAGTFPFSSYRAISSTIRFSFKILKSWGRVRPLHIDVNLSKLLGFDARFPNQNQSVLTELTEIKFSAYKTSRTKHCWQNYVDYHKCILAKGEDFAPCRQVCQHASTSIHANPLPPKFFLAYRSLCPSAWCERWDDQRGTLSVPIRTIHGS